MKPSHRWFVVCALVHTASRVGRDCGGCGSRSSRMLVRGNTASGTDRPGNNLLRRLNASDFALLAPHLAHQEAQPNELLYNPGDDVQVVYFPCGPSLVSFLVPNEDGRDVETILVGREGAVGGIVSLGYLPRLYPHHGEIRRGIRAATCRKAGCGEGYFG